MPFLAATRTGLRIHLRTETKIGRASTNHLRISAPEVSNEHALIRWRGERWEIQDLHSSNGTLVNDDKLAPGVWTPIEEGDRLAFGHLQIAYDFEEAGPPQAS